MEKQKHTTSDKWQILQEKMRLEKDAITATEKRKLSQYANPSTQALKIWVSSILILFIPGFCMFFSAVFAVGGATGWGVGSIDDRFLFDLGNLILVLMPVLGVVTAAISSVYFAYFDREMPRGAALSAFFTIILSIVVMAIAYKTGMHYVHLGA